MQTRHFTAPMHAPVLQYWIQLPFEQHFGCAKKIMPSTAVTMLTSTRCLCLCKHVSQYIHIAYHGITLTETNKMGLGSFV